MPSLRVWLVVGFAFLALASGAQHAHHDQASAQTQSQTQTQTQTRSWDFFTNFGSYMPRTHCVVNAEGKADWPWIITLVTLTLGIILAYARIYYFWIKTHREQDSRDRNKKMFELANIFLWCAICGYGFSVVAFAWPAYRLLAVALFLLNIWSWKFILTDLGEFKQSLCAKAMEREFLERLEQRNAALEREVGERTAQLERALQRAEDASIAKSQFLATMSHEIRTPMTAILGYAELLAKDEPTQRSAEHSKAAAETIHANSKQLLLIIDDILDVSKIEAGKMTLERVEVGVTELLEDVRRSVEQPADQKRLELAFAYDSALPDRITGDPTRLRQILVNIVGNAIKFTQKGRVSVRVEYEPGPDTLRFEVTDTGTGIGPEQLRRIARFEAFSQGDSSTTRRFGGTGLGLKISHELSRLMGGNLTIDSVLGIGTSVVLRLPAGTSRKTRLIQPGELGASTATPSSLQTTEQPRLPEQDQPLVGTSILLVEDGPDNQRLFGVILSRCGASVTTAGNGQDALDLIAERGYDAFDIVLMDMQMPVLDGFRASRLLRTRGFRRPIIALTAHAMQGSRQRCMSAGCDDYLTKPVERSALVAACIRWKSLPVNRDAA